jgi:hypothetical protein
MKFPHSYRNLAKHGITDDYSMGYSSLNGFRAGTCTPFLFYDLGREETTSLRIHPFIFMDTAMIDHLKLSPAQAFEEIKSLVDRVKDFGGEATGIWHNYALGEQDQYKGWQKLLADTSEYYKNTGE